MTTEEIKQEFVFKCVKEYLEDLTRTFPAEIDKKKIGITNTLRESFSYNAVRKGGGASGTLSFNESGRFVDMGVGRKHSLGGIEYVSIQLASSNKSGLSEIKQKGRAPKKWYSPILYAKLNYMENKLMHGFSDAAREEILKLKNV